MKRTLNILIFIFLPIIIYTQSLAPSVISSSGDYFQSTNYSLSWTLGEIMTETFSNGSNVLTQGFQQPFGVRIKLDIKVFLEGPFAGSDMQTKLNNEELIPLNQPYNIAPWNYPGSESVLAIPNNDVVDWILVELRNATDAASATPSTIISQQAGWLLKDGTITDINGANTLLFNKSFSQNLYVVVWHRNHLGIMSANQPALVNGVYEYDFSIANSQVFNGGLGYKEIATGSGMYGMVAGDANQDGLINEYDIEAWKLDAGKNGYLSIDFNLDAQINNPDKNDSWAENQDYSDQVPD